MTQKRKELVPSSQFCRDLKRELKGRYKKDVGNGGVLESVLTLLASALPLPQEVYNHPLKGHYRGCHECHLRPDLLLIYRLKPAWIELVRLGSHSELF
ncbi:MAG: type II toxin-antitoxin system YafQ family toxin [Paludibacterium sp.]|uniref:type II toxin-antitoxin system YafQ family toxin n=1 Tax=Paludibacterium sp. TaxID=1917523 RepID=UPI00344DC1B9|nr:type II toxin-antitoxin system YafQ family toxin [Paludibacterium sp.]MBV8647965.1 type II toxin-antitoxin system YafQ family toxin [Paludibacterium sp.]